MRRIQLADRRDVIEIRIKGPPKSGKTSIAAAVAATLRRQGHRVKVDDGDRLVTEQQDTNPTIHVYTEQDDGKGR